MLLSAKAARTFLKPSRPAISKVSTSATSNSFHASSTTLAYSLGCRSLLLCAYFASKLFSATSSLPYRAYGTAVLASLPDRRGWIPSSALTAALLLRLEYRRKTFAASSSLTTFLFPAHTSPRTLHLRREGGEDKQTTMRRIHIFVLGYNCGPGK